MKHKVAVGTHEDLRVVLDKIGGLGRFVKSGDKVFIKPNLCAPKSYETGTTTNPYLIEEVIKLLSDISKDIIIGDGPIPAFQRLSSSSHPLIYKIAEKYGIEVLDLNYSEKKTVGSFVISRPVLDADVIINMPVLKTHVRTGITCSLKNMMGVVPLRLKHEMHKHGLDNRIAELAKTIKPHLNIVDATVCQEGDGPTNGTPKEMGLVVAGDNQVAVDGLCCKIIGINPYEVPHIRSAERKEIGSIRDVEYIGFEAGLACKFKLPMMYKNIFIRFAMKVAEGAIIKAFERNNRILIDEGKCAKCGLCVKSCPVNALTMAGKKPEVDDTKCILCLCCHEVCLSDAIRIRKKGITKSGIIKGLYAKK